MTDGCNPLLIQELLEHCISFLRNSPSDLKRCALVSRRWAGGAQSHLSQKISIGKKNRWFKLHATLNSSPHLIRHIQSLIVRHSSLSDDAFSAVCNFAFTDLRQLYIYAMSPSHPPPSILPLKSLLIRPNLNHLILQLDTAPTPSFFPLWNHCSRSVRHLELYFSQGSSVPYKKSPNRTRPPVPLESLRIMTMSRVSDIGDWLTDSMGPFDLTNLRVLSIVNCPEDRWPILPPIFRSITALEFTAQGSGAPFDLSTLPKLETLRIDQCSATTTQMVMGVVSTVGPANHIRRLLLNMARYFDAEDCVELDAKLADVFQELDPLPTVELQMDAAQYGEYVQSFPRLNAHNVMRRFEPTRSWFSDYAGATVPY
ncbi:hypothetical protein C8R47DRAFT_99115 [Mycena vitilis]|nr:hypothetical protein C8R47DRAFT_99115 [Mycena vitilis]